MKRRNFLALVGGGVILAAGGAATSVAMREPAKALQPWQRAGTAYEEPRKRALSYAILAPNPHNRQPWLVDLRQDGQVILTVDTEKMLPHTDPFNRQITIGLGCFLELMEMAAAQDGYRVETTLFPEGSDAARLDNRPVAICRFAKDKAVTGDALFAHVMDRRSLKEPYDTARPVDAATLQKVLASGRAGTSTGGSVEESSIAYWRQLTEEALTIELETHRTYKESVDLFRIGAREVDANPDGIDFTGPMFELMGATGVFSRKAAMDRGGQAYKGGVDAVLESTRTAMGHVWLLTPSNSREDQIAAGRDWLRINLATTDMGLGIQPLSQALQEYPEMAAHYEAAHKRLAADGGTVQMLARIGYAAAVPPSPRWPLEAKMIG